MKPKLCIGVPYYGAQDAEWWVPFSANIGLLSNDFEVTIITSGTMATDHNRNKIVAKFLETDAEWLFWVDADTIVPRGAVNRLLAMGKTLASGLYYGKNDPHPPIAYVKANNAFVPLSNTRNWERGEIIAVDASGMGCMLTHRSVFEDIKNQHTVLQRNGGGLLLVHNNDIEGAFEQLHPHDGKVYKGQYRQRVAKPTIVSDFPFFALEFGRTEDMWFFDHAARCGHKVWLDTSVECGHLRPLAFTGKDYREIHGN